MKLIQAALYRPCRTGSTPGRTAGPDEDVVTMSIAAAGSTIERGPPARLILISRQANTMPTSAPAVLRLALRLPGMVDVQIRHGGGPDAVEALSEDGGPTLVVAAELGDRAGAAAAMIGPGEGLERAGRLDHGAPLAAGQTTVGDLRLFRDQIWGPAVATLASGARGELVIVGAPAELFRDVARQDPTLRSAISVDGAPAPLFAFAALRSVGQQGRILAIDGGRAAAADLKDLSWDVRTVERRATVALPPPPAEDAVVPLTAAAYERAFEAKVGLKASRCECGDLALPPRKYCARCGGKVDSCLVPLPRRAVVYTTTTVHVPVPGFRSPYSVAIVQLEGTDVRVLAPVADAAPSSVRIGDHGNLVLRILASREGVPDYGYAFQPDEVA